MSLHHDRLRAQHGYPLHQDHTEHLETGIASAVHEIDEMRAALDRVRALADKWDSLPCVCGYQIPNGNDDDSQCLSCASVDLRTVLDGDA